MISLPPVRLSQSKDHELKKESNLLHWGNWEKKCLSSASEWNLQGSLFKGALGRVLHVKPRKGEFYILRKSHVSEMNGQPWYYWILGQTWRTEWWAASFISHFLINHWNLHVHWLWSLTFCQLAVKGLLLPCQQNWLRIHAFRSELCGRFAFVELLMYQQIPGAFVNKTQLKGYIVWALQQWLWLCDECHLSFDFSHSDASILTFVSHPTRVETSIQSFNWIH